MSSEAESNWKISEPQAAAAWEMAEVYVHNLDENQELTQEGFGIISTIFGQVAEEERGAVFIQFLAELDEREIVYDVEDFMAPVPEYIH